MANNRIYIRCLGCQALKSIAKYYPSGGFYQHRTFEDFIQEHDHCKEFDVSYGPVHFSFLFETEDFQMYKDGDQWRYKL